jgi:hypothetical protein
MNFSNLEQRMAQTYIDLFPRFVPDENAPVSVSEQEEFYALIKNLYQLAFDEPLLFVSTLHEDDAHPNRFNKSSYGKPDLQKDMKKFIKEMDTLLQNMYLVGQGSVVEFSKRQRNILSKLGINDFTKLPKAWVWMSSRPEANVVTFSHCLFNKDYPYTSEIYARLLGETAFHKLENWMIGQGYKRYDIYKLIGSDCKLSLSYANPLWDAEPPRGGFEYKIRHTGISARYEALVQNPPVFGLCIPNGLKAYLNVFDSMNEKLQKFVIAHTKKCDGCRYCVQTDKTGSRPLVYVKVNYEQKEYNLCPYFPGYSYCWTSVDDDLANQLIDFLSFMDKYIMDATPRRFKK